MRLFQKTFEFIVICFTDGRSIECKRPAPTRDKEMESVVNTIENLVMKESFAIKFILLLLVARGKRIGKIGE